MPSTKYPHAEEHPKGASRSTPAVNAAPSSWSQLSYALRLARRELRGGVRGFRVFLACLVLGVGAIAGIGSLTEAVVAGIRGDARLLLGGDVSARLTYRPAGEAERQFLAASGTLSEVAKLRAMARSLDGARRSLIELQAVAEAAVASRLGLKLGDRFRVGEAALQLRAVIEQQPDAAFGALDFGPHVMISQAAPAQTGLIR